MCVFKVILCENTVKIYKSPLAKLYLAAFDKKNE